MQVCLNNNVWTNLRSIEVIKLCLNSQDFHRSVSIIWKFQTNQISEIWDWAKRNFYKFWFSRRVFLLNMQNGPKMIRVATLSKESHKTLTFPFLLLHLNVLIYEGIWILCFWAFWPQWSSFKSPSLQVNSTINSEITDLLMPKMIHSGVSQGLSLLS
jgi:hypothetical protein